MVRGPHRRIDESPLEGSPYFARIAELAPDWKLDAFFPRPQPLEVEVGSGKGLFLAHATTTQPARNFLGIELIKKYAAGCALKLQKLGVDN